jgi:hypothetical protein
MNALTSIMLNDFTQQHQAALSIRNLIENEFPQSANTLLLYACQLGRHEALVVVSELCLVSPGLAMQIVSSEPCCQGMANLLQSESESPDHTLLVMLVIKISLAAMYFIGPSNMWMPLHLQVLFKSVYQTFLQGADDICQILCSLFLAKLLFVYALPSSIHIDVKDLLPVVEKLMITDSAVAHTFQKINLPAQTGALDGIPCILHAAVRHNGVSTLQQLIGSSTWAVLWTSLQSDLTKQDSSDGSHVAGTAFSYHGVCEAAKLGCLILTLEPALVIPQLADGESQFSQSCLLMINKETVETFIAEAESHSNSELDAELLVSQV